MRIEAGVANAHPSDNEETADVVQNEPDSSVNVQTNTTVNMFEEPDSAAMAEFVQAPRGNMEEGACDEDLRADLGASDQQ